MRVGITFGCYCPLHQGHLDVIMRAKKENDLTFVFVCGYDNDRGGDILPLLKRYRIISNFLADDCLVVKKINDTLLGIDESMSKENWKIWSSEAMRQIRESIDCSRYDIEYTWYVSEPSYKNEIDNLRVGECVLLDRSENPVSGTLCRTQPLKYWNKITPPFRAYFSKNILIAGTASEGKTTLCRDIGKYFAIPYSYEKGRDNCAIKTDPEFTVKDFIYNLYEQHKLNEELICSPQNPGVFISDTDNMVTLMYIFMITWAIPVEYVMSGFVYIEANSLDDAIDIAISSPDVGLPDNAEYVDGSFVVTEDIENIRIMYNNSLGDEPDKEDISDVDDDHNVEDMRMEHSIESLFE